MSERARQYYMKKGIDPDQRGADNLQMHKEYAELSTNGKLTLVDGDHNSIYTKKENADVICREILQLLEVDY